jgi:hypothetical protein
MIIGIQYQYQYTYLCAEKVPIAVATHRGCLVLAVLSGKGIIVVVRSHCTIATMLRANVAVGRLNGGCDTFPPIQAHMVIDIATLFGR